MRDIVSKQPLEERLCREQWPYRWNPLWGNEDGEAEKGRDQRMPSNPASHAPRVVEEAEVVSKA